MAFIGSILQEVVKRKKFIQQHVDGVVLQEKVLRKLLLKAQFTAFGNKYNFSKILKSNDVRSAFNQNVPVYDYNKMLDEFWQRTKNGEANISWPGKVKYFGLTSGTSDAASKTVPITSDMIKAIRRTSLSQLETLSLFDLPASFYEKSVLMLGGSTDLIKVENRYEGDLSGILTKNIPKWFSRFYKPGYKISNIRDWATKLEQITINAHKWDIGIIAGVPAWVQILLEKIVAHYNVKDIHEIWPNLQLFIHGGVSFAPYKNSLSKYLGKEIYFLETYLASEGFLAFRHADENAMKLVLNNGIYFEFVPFNGKNFTDEGNLVENPEILKLDQVQECIEYALLISTCSGAWRYLIGDTIKFTSLERYDIVITGRTKHFLSMCGEHLSVDNMNKAIKTISEEENIIINEFTVAGISYDNLFAHKWFLAIDTEVDKLLIKDKLDKCLAKLNDDYGVERKAALKEVIVEVVPTKYFYEWMRLKGKEGAQNKFPRVMKKDQFEDWENFIFKNKS